MIDFIAMFENNLIDKELSQSRKHGIKIVIPIRSLIRNEKGLIEKKQSLPTILLQFYKKLYSIMISWSISRKNQKTINIFKENKWLIETTLIKVMNGVLLKNI